MHRSASCGCCGGHLDHLVDAGFDVVELLQAAPAVGGVALPGMPAGSPGMDGEQDRPWVLTTFTDGVEGEVLTER